MKNEFKKLSKMIEFQVIDHKKQESNEIKSEVKKILKKKSESNIIIYPKYKDLTFEDLDILLKKVYNELTLKGILTSNKFIKFICNDLKVELEWIDVEIKFKLYANQKGYLDFIGFSLALEELSHKLYSGTISNKKDALKKFSSLYLSDLMSNYLVKDIFTNMIRNFEFSTVVTSNIDVFSDLYIQFFPILKIDNLKDKLSIEKEIKLCFLSFLNEVKIVPNLISIKKAFEIFNKVHTDTIENEKETYEFFFDKNIPNYNESGEFDFYSFVFSIFYISYYSQSNFFIKIVFLVFLIN